MAKEKVINSNEESSMAESQRPRSEVRFPAYGLTDSVNVAKAIHEKGGGKANPDQLAAYLGYKSTSNGAYLARIGAARLFGIVEKSGDHFVPTLLAQQILMPTYPEQTRRGLVEAFMKVALFERVFNDFKGKELPPELGMKNALRNTYGVVPSRVEIAYRVLMESADTAGFFSTREARTHLIMPSLQATATPSVQPPSGDDPKLGGGGGANGRGNGNTENNDKPPTVEAVKARYIQTLINVLEEKGKNGELDETLMTRIEKLLELK